MLRNYYTDKGQSALSGDEDPISINMTEATRLVNRLKNTNIEKFRTMCKMHLSFLLDLPGSSLDELLGQFESSSNQRNHTNKRHSFAFYKKLLTRDKSPDESIVDIFGVPLNPYILDRIYPLIDYLKKPENLKQEGLFRKSGHLVRQRELREQMNSFCATGYCSNNLNLEHYTAHDCACLLKTFLSELPEPLLTERLCPAYSQIPEMGRCAVDDESRRHASEKQLQTIQLLLQLIPEDNSSLIHELLVLLNLVANEPANKMTADTIAMVFAPHMLMSKRMAPMELRSASTSVIQIVSFMIQNSSKLFLMPEPLIRDVANYWDEMDNSEDINPECNFSPSRNHSKRAHDPSTVLNTVVSFADRQASEAEANYTDIALAQLYAHLQTMPNSAKKRKLVKQFNKASGVGTPTTQPRAHSHEKIPSTKFEKRKRTKSLGESIKKLVSHHHHSNKQATHHILQEEQNTDLENKDENLPAVSISLNEMSQESPRQSPQLRSSNQSDAPSVSAPLLKLRNRVYARQEPTMILPSSPKVHIIDLKQDLMELNQLFGSPKNIHLEKKATGTGNGYIAKRGHRQQVSIKRAQSVAASDHLNRSHKDLVGDKSPDFRYGKPTAFISPMSRSISAATDSIQKQVLTPGCRRPLSVVKSPEVKVKMKLDL